MYVCNRFAIFPNVTLGKCQVQVIIENKQTPPKRVIKSRQTRVVILLISRLPTTFLRTPLQMSPLLLVVAVVFLVVSPSICFLTYTNQYFVLVVGHGLITLFFIDVFFLIFYCYLSCCCCFCFGSTRCVFSYMIIIVFVLHLGQVSFTFCRSLWGFLSVHFQINNVAKNRWTDGRTDRPRKIN